MLGIRKAGDKLFYSLFIFYAKKKKGMEERALAGDNAVVKNCRGVKGKEQKSSRPFPHTFFQICKLFVTLQTDFSKTEISSLPQLYNVVHVKFMS